ncbi:2,3,4,5-tetrahydropyridine-2,6-dicarboxylate N-succinyltransferase [Candidatus Arcanobacter lacustris]|jgi:2,3,4,5-tetrahydropyridine-2-carboxylate N-succinyltransferase|uniref:2,3,4,5-tetrahydropyridine-2,6-dicarboxylate N-succinyltransferase n=1 Tax=Candidatus Arcanibacter lacustris TaxID=1607817 RepID=A0A0F5MP13_9RICK|nr:2,3,4,5-tetrahydropyridine-2,6-dicarboxylate N-succinyltransferase [Candidatus Arcanobacter lacustris]
MDKSNIAELQSIINQAWDQKDSHLLPSIVHEAIDVLMKSLDDGEIRVAEKQDGKWVVNEWIKKSILLSFKTKPNKLISGGASGSNWYDKIDSKFLNWDEDRFKNSGFRATPGSIARFSAYVAKGVVLMPCFLNVGSYIDEGTMIDSWSTIGSCAQIGKNCHISGGVGIGGVLEPLQASPVIIEDNCFIGARSEIAEGVIVEEGSVISMGVYIGASTKIYDRETSQIYYGRVPAYSVVVPGNLPSSKEGDMSSLYAAIIVKKVDEKTRAKTSINELLRA